MTTEEFQKQQEDTFDAFCKTVIRNESRNIHKKLAHQAQREVALSDLSISDYQRLCYEDTYHPFCKNFFAQGFLIKIHDPLLAEVLQLIQPKYRDIILLSFFLELSDTEISHMLQISNGTVTNRRSAALMRLKRLLEGNEK